MFAPDLAEARRFYVGVLGFAMLRESDSSIELAGAGFDLTIFKCESSGSADGYSIRAGSSLAMSTADLAETIKHLRKHGVTILHDEPGSGPAGRYVAFCDPFGAVHEFVESRG